MSVLLALLLCVQCAAIGKPTDDAPTPRPGLSNNDYQTWRAYYDDQFTRRHGEVAMPGEDYPETAHQAYRQAKEQWDTARRSYRRTETAVIFILLIGVVAVLVLSGPSIDLGPGEKD